MTVSFHSLEEAFERVIEKNRRGNTQVPCTREALFAPAFFHVGDDTPTKGVGMVPNKLPFDQIWLVTNYKGLGIVALCERMEIGAFETVRPDYLWYPTTISGERVNISKWEIEEEVTFVIDRALQTLLTNHLAEVDSPIQQRINRGRARARTNPLPDLPKFIRIADRTALTSEPSGGTHASPQPHMRRGHWRTYRKSGKKVWINEMAINGGSPVPRNYRLERSIAA